MDNHTSHHTCRVKRLLEQNKIEYRYLPVASSELNPIELVWSVFKHWWRELVAEKGSQIRPKTVEEEIDRTMKEKVGAEGKVTRIYSCLYQKLASLLKPLKTQ